MLAACLVGAGCSSGAGGPSTSNAAGGGGPAAAGVAAVSGGGGAPAAAGAAGAASSGKLSFANDVFPKVIRVKCGSCHNDAPSFGGLAFFPGPELAYTNLVGVPSGDKPAYQCAGSGLNRVQPGEPENSLIYLKLTLPPCGGKMPPPAFGTATPEQVELVRQWIVDGALP